MHRHARPRPARRRGVRVRPRLPAGRLHRRTHDGRAAPAREGRDQPSRPGGARAAGAPGRLMAGPLIAASAAPGSVKTRAAALSIASNSILIVLKLAAAAITGSVAILTEAMHSSVDL